MKIRGVFMDGSKTYLQSVGTVLNAIIDLVEFQKGRITHSDTPGGKVSFLVRMYAFKWELQFTVTDIGENRCRVRLEISGENRGREKFIRREFTLLDTFLATAPEIKIKETDRQGK